VEKSLIRKAVLILKESISDDEKENKIAYTLKLCDELMTQGVIVRLVGKFCPNIAESMGEKLIMAMHGQLPGIGLKAFLLSLKNPVWPEDSLFDCLEKGCLKNILGDRSVAQNPMITGLIYELVRLKRPHLLNFAEKQIVANGILVAYMEDLDSLL